MRRIASSVTSNLPARLSKRLEVAGASNSQRAVALDEALALDKNHAPARWQRGEVLENGKWLKIDEASKKHASHLYLRGYEKKRRETRDTEEGNWELAAWCELHSLWSQKYAHLCRVVELNPQNQSTRIALGWRQTNLGWVSPEQVIADLRFARDEVVSQQSYGAKVNEIVQKLTSPKEGIVELGEKDLASLTNPSAVIAIEQSMSSKSEPLALRAVGAIGAISHPAATRSLVRHAVYHPNPKVRERAGEQLVQREAQGWAPALLELIRSEVALEFRPEYSESGDLIGLRHVFSQENRGSNDTLVSDTSYIQYLNTFSVGTVAVIGGQTVRLRDEDGNAATVMRPVDAALLVGQVIIANHNEKVDQQFRIGEHAKQTASSPTNWTASHNAAAKIINLRAFSVLDRYAKKKIGDKPKDYWEWWQLEKKWGYGGYRPNNVVYQKSGIIDTRNYAGFTLVRSCLVGSTLVSLQQGPKPIKQVRVGDVVNCKDIETGRIHLAPVTRITESKELVDLIAFRAGNETIECSKGHEFFVSGKGWMKACDMKAGDTLHTAEGPIKIESIVESGKAPVYNLVVANYANYFVGDGKILSHDLTERAENYYLVPGLAPESK